MESTHTYSPGGYIPIGEVAKLLGVTVGTVRRWDKAGRISAVRTPTGHRRFSRDDVLALLSDKASA